MRARRLYPLIVCAFIAVMCLLGIRGASSAGAAVEAAPTDAGQWVAPAGDPIQVLRGFAPPAQRWMSGHRGVDLAAPSGGVIVAAGAGVVTFAGTLAGRGVVTVTHGALRTTYEPVRATVVVGDRVQAGQPIGTLDSGPAHCLARSCLHWGLLRGDTYLDPLSLLRRGPSRLLPVWPGRGG
jgi:murein DD-endopeptidase MepM/ murein hydrolase activator NlpD